MIYNYFFTIILLGGDIINKSIKVKKIILIYSIITLSILIYNHGTKKEIISNDDINDEAYDKYSKGLIYIGDKDFLNSLNNLEKYDILVEDLRNSNNPTMKIRNSYLINDSTIRNEILKILCKYEEEYPSNWNRTIETMNLEWETHNILYYLNYKKDHTTDVDLDNNDEEKYSKILRP